MFQQDQFYRGMAVEQADQFRPAISSKPDDADP
jgi:hypothetical protein